jgi:2Fe-2S ferredoxin
MSVMQAAMANDVPGIIGECGGSAMCATCHVYVEAGQLPLLEKVAPVEDAALGSTAAERRSNSRLGCQITVTDGLVVHIPETQR